MGDLKRLRQQLELAFASYMQLSDDEQHAATEMTVLMLRQMLREQSGRRQRLIELGGAKHGGTTKQNARSNAEKARSKLVRKSNAASPQAPIKPVQVTKKNELRRK